MYQPLAWELLYAMCGPKRKKKERKKEKWTNITNKNRVIYTENKTPARGGGWGMNELDEGS